MRDNHLIKKKKNQQTLKFELIILKLEYMTTTT